MRFDFGTGGDAVAAEVADIVDAIGAEEVLALREEIHRLGAERHADTFHRLLARRKLLAIRLPEPHGRSATPTERYALHEGLDAAGMPTYSLEMNEGMASMILRHGLEALVDEHLPKLLAGEWTYAGGYSEPEAGSDLLALSTRAVRDGDHYLVTGTKLWTSSGHLADWIVTIVRTDPASSRHQGLSVLVIDATAPGVTIDGVPVVGGWRVNAVSFDEVRVPVGNLLGEEGLGWKVITTALNDERAMSFGGRESRLLLARLVARWRTENVDDVRLAELGELVAELEVDRLLNLRLAGMAERDEDAVSEASISKVFSSELAQRVATWLADVLAPGSLIPGHEDPLRADAEQALRTSTAFTIMGGTSEVQRNIIADRGLGLPR